MDATAVTDIFGEYSPIIPMAILIIGALIMPALYFGFKKKAPVTAIALIFMIASIAVNLIMLLGDNYPEEYRTFSRLFTYDAFSGLMMLLFQIVALIVLFVSVSSKETTTLHFGAYNALLLVATSGMMFVASANDLVAIFVGVETVSIPSYALVAMKRNDARAAEAAVKYVIVGGMSTALTVYGISMIYGALGTLTLSELGPALAAEGYTWAFVIGIICMIAGYGFKIAAVPFHMWAPDVYEGASTPVTIFLATGSKKMGIVVYIKIFLVMFLVAEATSGLGIEEIQYFFAIIAAFSMTVGNVVAIAQNNVKRMLAYSSIAQAGYILIVMAVMSQYALEGSIFHMFTHVFMKGGAFLVVGAFISAGIGEKLSDYNGLAKRAPLTSFAMLLFLFSLAGIPPLAGFTSKFVLFSATIFTSESSGVMTEWIWLAFVAIINSAISLYYYVRVVKAMYVEKPAEGTPATKLKLPRSFEFAILCCAVAVVVLGVYPELISGVIEDAAASVFAGINA
ncbi:MAG: NADH-quinone oxidoreductase subunit N [Methanomethylophilus sp.]|jgi:proton-translocating NADH-quinone oxidoreductase chain N